MHYLCDLSHVNWARATCQVSIFYLFQQDIFFLGCIFEYYVTFNYGKLNRNFVFTCSVYILISIYTFFLFEYKVESQRDNLKTKINFIYTSDLSQLIEKKDIRLIDKNLLKFRICYGDLPPLIFLFFELRPSIYFFSV